MRIFPNVTAVAAAFARLQRPWQGVAAVSCHGREAEADLAKALTTRDTVAVYTDPRHDPAWLAGWLMDRGFGHWRICVAERMGTPEERMRTFTPAEARDQAFAEPNLAILDHEPEAVPPPAPAVAMSDDAFVHHKGLISKPEVRAISLAKLRLFSDCVLWDLGAGSGAVGIEAAAWIARGRIVAVERRAERLEMIRQNRLRHGVRHLEVVQADLPGGMDALPDPDRIFVGGGGRQLGPILDAAVGRLGPGGIIVVNTVLLASLETAQRTFARLGLETETVQIQVNRSRATAHSQRFEAENPVWITTGHENLSSNAEAVQNHFAGMAGRTVLPAGNCLKALRGAWARRWEQIGEFERRTIFKILRVCLAAAGFSASLAASFGRRQNGPVGGPTGTFS